MGLNLHFSTSFHMLIDGQTDRVNALLEFYLIHFMSANQCDWPNLLDVAQFSYTLQRSKATQHSPFEIMTSRQPHIPQALVKGTPQRTNGRNVGKEQLDVAKAYLDKTSKKMKK